MTKKAFLWIIPVLLFVAGILYVGYYTSKNKEPIKVGILHSLTGIMAMSESQLADASLMAIDEINREGGIAGATHTANYGRREVGLANLCR
jgi:ABC-type branched-subunit amino acid transport system substrate-binding protein